MLEHPDANQSRLKLAIHPVHMLQPQNSQEVQSWSSPQCELSLYHKKMCLTCTCMHYSPAKLEAKELDLLKSESTEKRPVLLCIKIKDEAGIKKNRRPAIITKLEEKVAKKFTKRKKSETEREEKVANEKGIEKVEAFQVKVLAKVESDGSSTSQETITGSYMQLESGEEGELRMEESTSTSSTPQEKLANAEKKLAEEIEMKKEKRLKYKTLIEENENHLKILSKEMQDVEEAIKNKEGKIMEMKLERKEKPLFKKLGSQFGIAKSVLKKERLEDDLSVLKGQSASRRRLIQKYKTKIRYDLQILNDTSVTTIKPLQEPRAKQTPRPIPPCFFASGSGCDDSKQQVVVAEPMNSLTACTAEWPCGLSVREKPSSTWSLSSIDDEANSLLAQRIQNERDTIDNGRLCCSSGQLQLRCVPTEFRQGVERLDQGCGLTTSGVASSAASDCIGINHMERMET